MSLFFGMNIALKGMMAQQAALNVTSNNIANASTDGYSRQQVNLEASTPISGIVTGEQLGSGVDVSDVARVRNEFFDYQLRTQTSDLNSDTTIHDTLGNVETVINETSSDTGLSSEMDSFWNAWQDVSVTPASSAVRTTLMESAVTLTDSIRQLSSQLTGIQDDINKTQIPQSVENVNSISARIATLNGQIVTSEANGETPNDLLDKRDLLLDQLSATGNITVTKRGTTGAVDVIFGTMKDKPIVDKDGAHDLNSSAITASSVTGGSLGALAQLGVIGDAAPANTVQYYINKLDTLAAGIATRVNGVHFTGTNLEGKSGDDNVGADFFVSKDGSSLSAANICVNSAIQDDVSKIAASGGTTNLTGNGDIALKIADLKDTKLTSGLGISDTGTITIGAFYQDMVTELGSKVNEAKSNITNQQTLVDNLSSKKESVSGVSLDEETTNIVLYQHAYSACAKVISVMDEMLDTIINNMKA
jgi:flagellar hook-associated protein 1 FlgK